MTAGRTGGGLVRAAGACLALSWRAGRGRTLAVVALAVLTGLFPSALAWLGKLVVDELVAGSAASVARVCGLAAAVAGCVALNAALSQAGGFVGASLQRAVTIEVQTTLYARVSAFGGLRPFEDPEFRDRLQLAQDGAHEAPHSTTALISECLRAAVTIVGFTVVIALVWPPMLVLLAAAAVPAMLTYRSLGRRSAETSRATMGRVRRQIFYQMLLTDPLANREIRLFGLGGLFRRRLRESLSETSARELRDERRSSLYQTGIAVLGAVIAAIGTIVMAREVIGGTLTLGGLTMFTAAAASMQATLSALMAQGGDVVRALTLFRHYTDVMATPADLPDGTAPVPPLAGAIELQDVWFRYDDDGPWILRGVTLTIPRGGATGLVGLNGAGKSTVVKLLCRFYDPERGRILWDGVDLRHFRTEDLRRRIGATFQDFTRYDLTVAENIGVGDVTRLDDTAGIRRAATLAGVDDAIGALPKGYDTMLSRTFFDGEDDLGVQLSGGQWQRVAVARSLMRSDMDLLVLDEPNSGLDPDGEAAVHTTLRTAAAGRTTLLISHRLGTLRDADRIVVLAGGRVTETGTHDDLMDADGEYARLFRTQAAGYRDPVLEGDRYGG